MTNAFPDPKSAVASYNDQLAYFENVGNCLEKNMQDELSECDSMLDAVCTEMIRSLRESILVLTISGTSKAFERIIPFLKAHHVQKIWLVLTGSFSRLAESSTGSFVLQKLICQCSDENCLSSLVNEIAINKALSSLVWSKSGSHVMESFFVRIDEIYQTTQFPAIREKMAFLAKDLSIKISEEIRGKQVRAFRNQSTATVLIAMCKASTTFHSILKILKEKVFIIGHNSSFPDNDTFLKQLMDNNITCRLIECLFAVDYEFTCRNLIFSERSIDEHGVLRLPQSILEPPLQKNTMHLFSTMISLAPLDGEISLQALWKTIFTSVGSEFTKKDQYAVVFVMLERNLYMESESLEKQNDPSSVSRFFHNVQSQIRDLLGEEILRKNLTSNSEIPYYGISHMLMAESLVGNGTGSKFGIHLFHLLMKLESIELRRCCSKTYGLDERDISKFSEKQKWYIGMRDDKWAKDRTPLLQDFLTVPSDLIRRLALDPEGSRILQLIVPLLRLQDEVSLQSHICSRANHAFRNVSHKKKQKFGLEYPRLSRFIRRFRNHLVQLACDTYGSHFVEIILCLAENYQDLSSVADPIKTSNALRELRSTVSGRILIRKYALEKTTHH